MPLFRVFLRQAITDKTGRLPKRIFFAYNEQDFPNLPQDYKLAIAGIPPGTQWEAALNGAIRGSRCMVGLWAPTYFHSPYCNREWHSFRHRVTQTCRRVVFGASWYDGIRSLTKPNNFR